MSRGTAIDPARRARILASYEELGSASLVAERFGMTPQGVGAIVNKAGIAKRGKGPRT